MEDPEAGDARGASSGGSARCEDSGAGGQTIQYSVDSPGFSSIGDALWERFNMKDKDQIGWYYRSIAEALKWDLGETLAMKEYRDLVERTFGGA